MVLLKPGISKVIIQTHTPTDAHLCQRQTGVWMKAADERIPRSCLRLDETSHLFVRTWNERSCRNISFLFLRHFAIFFFLMHALLPAPFL